MKNSKKLFSLFTLILMVALTLCFTVACGETEPEEDQWDGKTYNVTVVLADGETPVKDMRLALCYNNADNTSNCLNPVKTDANGKATIVIPEEINVVGNPVLHIYKDSDIPDGYGQPANMVKVTMVDGAEYEHAIELTGKETKLVLSVA